MDIPPLESFTPRTLAEAAADFNEEVVCLAEAALEANPNIENLILQRLFPNRTTFWLFTRKYGIFEAYRSEMYWDPENEMI